MIRRVLLFLIVFATGLGILTLVIGRDELMPVADSQSKDASAVKRTLPPGAIRVGGGASGQAGTTSGTVAFEGAGEISPLQPEVRIGDRVWQPPEFKLAWEDSQPIGSGRYRLLRARFTSYASVKPDMETPAVREVLVVTAESMEVVLAQKADGEIAVDAEHDIGLRGVVLRLPRSALGRNFASEVFLRSDRMVARVRGRTMELETPPDELVTIETKPVDPSRARYVMTGLGLEARLDEIVKGRATDGDEDARREIVSVGASRVVLKSNVVVRAIAGHGGDREFVLRSDGQLDFRAVDPALYRIVVRENVRFVTRGSASSGEADPATEFQANGGMAVAWLRRGGIVRGDGGQLEDLAFTDLSIVGAPSDPSVPANMSIGGQKIVASRFDLALDAWTNPERLVASGSPRVFLTRNDGEPLGVVRGDARMFWERPGLAFEMAARVLGIDLAREMRGLDATHVVLPRETIRIEGPAHYAPAAPVDSFRNASCDGGALITLTSVLGKLEPNLVVGRGSATFAGTLRSGRDFEITGNRGFVVSHVPGSAIVRANLGPLEPDPEHAFVFKSAEDRVEGRGSVAIRFTTPALTTSVSRDVRTTRDGELRFVAALREELQWTSGQGEDIARVRGIKSLFLSGSTDKGRAVRASGLPLRFEIGDVVATSDVADRIDDTTWRFSKGFTPVRVVVPARQGLPPSTLDAELVRIVVMPDFVPTERPVPQLRMLATGAVRLETKDLESAVEVVLSCDELERFPDPARGLLLGAAADVLGDAGRLLAPVLWGSEAGLLHARGRVRVIAREGSGSDESRIATRTFEGDSLWLDADRGLGSFVLTGDESRTVSASIREPGRGTVLLEGAKITGRQGEFELGSLVNDAGAYSIVRLIEDGSPETARRLRLRSSGSVRLVGQTLRVPGPVVAELVDAEDRHPVGEFAMRSGGDVVVLLRAQAQLSEADRKLGIALPSTVESCEAFGGVVLTWAQVRADGERLRFTPADAWLTLERAGEGVNVTIAEDVRVHARPKLDFNLRTHAYRGSRLRVEGLVGSR